jgi:D-arabinose 1-dehydrogenase-like Zn-dependent alcohol dehydrogenase
MVICGRTAGAESTIDVAEFFLSHKRIVGSTMGTQDDLRRLVGFAAEGMHVPVDEVYPLEATGEAFAAMKERDQVGKIVVEP